MGTSAGVQEHVHTGPGYASPQQAREQPPERFIYVAALYEGTGIEEPDFIAITTSPTRATRS